MKRKKFILIDGHALLHRAFHAIPNLTTSKGKLVNGVYGFFLIFLNAIKELKPDYLAVCLDRREPTFRHEKFKDYKAQRPETPLGLISQIPLLKQGLSAFNIPVLEKKGYEADDLIASLVKKIKEKYPYIETIIITGDLDTLQLVQEGVKVLTLRRGLTDSAIYDSTVVEQRYGFSPNKLNDFKALRGDPSDNIPGVKGIGERTAQNLICKFGSIEEIYKRLNRGGLKTEARVLKALKKGKKQAFLSKELSQVYSDIKIKLNLSDFAFLCFNYEKVVQWFRQMEFKSLLTKIPKAEDQPSLFKEEPKKQKKQLWKLILIHKNDYSRFLNNLSRQKRFVFDVETSSLDKELIGISFCFKSNHAYFLPLANFSDFKLWDKKQRILGPLKKIFEDREVQKIGHNLKYDYKILKREGIEVEPLYFDTLIASWLLDPESRNYSLDRLSFVELGFQKKSLEGLFSKNEHFDLRKLPLLRIAEYSAEDSWITFLLFQRLFKRLKKHTLLTLMQKIEMPLIKVLSHMEENGIKIDKSKIRLLSRKVDSDIIKIQKKVYALAGCRFNLNSPLQLREILFRTLKLDSARIRKTKTGLSTAASELEKMKGQHKIVDLILHYRELAKLKNTYLDALPKIVDNNLRLHTNFNQTATATGRLSSSEPNLQNIPVRSKLGQKIRQAFIAEKGKKLITADYSQIELRIIAHLSRDANMFKAFQKGEDIHTATAALIYNKPPSSVSTQMRRVAKTVNFGVIYGMSPYGLAQSLGVSRNYASKFIDKYFRLFPKIRSYTKEVLAKARSKGYVETLFGRRRYLKDINSTLPDARSAAERAAINMPIQGSAADIIKMAMIKIFKKSPPIFPNLNMLLQVHDELVFEIDKSQASKARLWIKKIMENIVKLKVPLIAEVVVVSSWGDSKK